jgi:FkbM family methyltransferase
MSLLDNLFDKSLHYLGKKNNEVLALNIGAMDGVLFDEMIGYSTMYKFKGLYVEPIPYLFERLKNNISLGNLFENSAISDYNGEIEMMTIDKDVIDSGLVHNCFYGMSAVFPPRNGLGSEFDRPTVEKYGKLVKVPCITFETLMEKHNITKFDIIKIDAEGHDYMIFKQVDLKKYSPSVIRIEWINLSQEEQNSILDKLKQSDYIYELSGQDIIAIPKTFHDELDSFFNKKENVSQQSNVTLVTGLWNIGRSDLQEGWSRSFNQYLENFDKLLDVKENLIIFGDKELESFVWKKRSRLNTQFITRDLSWFINSEFYDKIQKIRNNPNWFNQVGWLKNSTQAKLDMYNPLVMSKMFLLHDAKIMDAFSSEYMFWIDAGLANTVHTGYFTHDNVLNKLPKYISKFSFICFPYDTTTEIHGFELNKLNSISGNKVNKVARGGFFGGPKNTIADINSIYYGLMLSTLNDGYMGTEESIFSIMCYKHSDLVNYFEIESNGLINKFFEDLKNDSIKVKSEQKIFIENSLDINKVGLYVLTFNSPNQFRTLVKSMLEYDKDFILKTKKYLLDNSTDATTFEEYSKLCSEYDFEHIKKNNLGICGGRQWIAEHFDKTDLDYYIFSEDDMFFQNKPGETCRNGFNRYSKNLYTNTLQIIKKENLDFIKYNFSEFYGDNSTQWSWYNVPQHIREEFWPEKTQLPVQGLDPNAPKTKFNNIKSHNGLAYADGEIYYCNWTQLISREGNKKMFLDTTWSRPFENTWMSQMYQLTKKGELKGGILLLTPVEHNRFEFYDGNLRKES